MTSTSSSDTPSHDVTQLLKSWSDGNQESVEALVPLVYDEMRRMAAVYLHGERTGHTLQPTALVHEAYFRLVQHDKMRWQDRAHFFAIAARTMRRILVDHARGQRSAKRGGPQPAISLDVAGDQAKPLEPDMVALDDTLKDLASMDPDKAKIVELRYFGGLSIEETAQVMDCSRATIIRQWRMAKAWIHSQLSADPP